MDGRLSNALPYLLRPSGSGSLMTMTMMEPTLNLLSVALARYALGRQGKAGRHSSHGSDLFVYMQHVLCDGLAGRPVFRRHRPTYARSARHLQLHL